MALRRERAPVKRLGTVLEEKPGSLNDDELAQDNFMSMNDGGMSYKDAANDIAFDEDEWMENIQIWKNL